MPLSYAIGQLTYASSFWSYELCKRSMASKKESDSQMPIKILSCGGIAGIVTWASIFPLDVIKTKFQASSDFLSQEWVAKSQPPFHSARYNAARKTSPLEIAREAYHKEGLKVFYRGLGVCSIRAFIVNAIQVRTSFAFYPDIEAHATNLSYPTNP
jgi:solute carrier family 25 (mitochondrial carnitine/acylcarnitine transporter), member 20/29